MWILAELLGLMDEPRHAQRMMDRLAAEAVRPEHRALVEAGSCAFETIEEPGTRMRATFCRFDTPCGVPVAWPVHFEPITGAVSDVWDLAYGVHDACPTMLTDDAARRMAEVAAENDAFLRAGRD